MPTCNQVAVVDLWPQNRFQQRFWDEDSHRGVVLYKMYSIILNTVFEHCTFRKSNFPFCTTIWKTVLASYHYVWFRNTIIHASDGQTYRNNRTSATFQDPKRNGDDYSTVQCQKPASRSELESVEAMRLREDYRHYSFHSFARSHVSSFNKKYCWRTISPVRWLPCTHCIQSWRLVVIVLIFVHENSVKIPESMVKIKGDCELGSVICLGSFVLLLLLHVTNGALLVRRKSVQAHSFVFL